MPKFMRKRKLVRYYRKRRKRRRKLGRKTSIRKNRVVYREKGLRVCPLPQQYYCNMQWSRHIYGAETSAWTLHEYTPTVPDKMDNVTTSGQNKCLYFDQMNALYNHYVVLGWRYDIEFVNLESEPLQVVVLPWPNGEDPTSNKQIDMQPRARSRLLSPVGGKDHFRMTGYVNVSKLFGVKNVEVEEDFWGTGTTSPSRAPRFYISISNAEGIQVAEFVLNVCISPYVKWFGREMQADPSA